MADSRLIIVMGVSGSGKTTLGRGLADRLGWEFLEGDDLHPEGNVAKMSAGIPLTDEDREPWLAALGAGLLLSGIVSGIVGAIFGTAGRQGLTEGGTTALVGLLITLLLAFLIGGYVAGRLASRSGFKHGLLVPLLALVVTIALAIVGGLLGVSFIDQLSGITLPQGAQQSAQQAAPQQGLGTILTVSGILALLFPFIGGAIGGLWGARTGRRRP